jgi:hypothetical protein
VVHRTPLEKVSHSDIYVAVRDGFSAIRRQLQDYVRVRRGETKRHWQAEHPKKSELLEAMA